MITKLKYKMLETVGPHKQNKLARELGINQARVSEYMAGSRTVPAQHLALFAQAFQCSPVDLVGYMEIPQTNLSTLST